MTKFKIALAALCIVSLGTDIRAQEEESALSVRLYNRTCADIAVRPLDGDTCPEGFETCDLQIPIGQRGDLLLAGAIFPSSVSLSVEGRCAPEDHAVISGTCQANLFSQAQRTINDPNAGKLDDIVRGVCNDISVDCPGIEEFREPSRMRHRTINIELGLCDAGSGGVDLCQPECSVP